MTLAVLVGVGLAVVGLYLSNWLDVASGATIVLTETALFLAVLALGPRTGVLSRLGRRSELVEATQ
jgi:ABC-type Mn2+/Zn2+ transport system permease subunit